MVKLSYSNLQMKHWNPGASAPLILPVHVVCNTPDDVLHTNIFANSRNQDDWFRQQPENDLPAIICGSGPSLSDTLDDIRDRVAAGGVLIALNGAARFLSEAGLEPGYQIILDARPETASLVGPARRHLFASQVDPACFRKAPEAQLWHLQIEGIDDLLPSYDRPFTLIGAASSVGTTALVITYALGHRDIHCYGLDSSNKGVDSHAFRQAINDGEPMASVTFGGKDYHCSLTMKMQAERFPETARLLQREGCRIAVHGYGLLPDIWNAPPETLSEREKYQRMWTMPEYREFAPGERFVGVFEDIVKPPSGSSVIDFGCGTGRMSVALANKGYDVTLVDFASNARDQSAAALPFFEFDLTEEMPLRADYGVCTDVLEHIPPASTHRALRAILESTPRLFISVDTKLDLMGGQIGQDLHLTLMHHDEWRSLLSRYGDVAWEQKRGDCSLFYIIKHGVD